MAIAIAQVRIPYDTGMPRDATVNTFAFTTAGADVLTTDHTEIVTRLRNFYSSVHPGATVALASQWGTGVDLANATIKTYDAGDVMPRAPIGEAVGITATTGTTVEPSELAAVLSFQGLRQSGQIQARRRGRIFFGPLATIALTSTYPVRLNANMIAAGNAAMKYLAGENDLPIGINWGVYSRTNQSVVDVHDGWVDNAVDIQRRRGEDATARTTWTL